MGCWTPPFGNPQVFAGAADLAELLAACAAGASVPLGKAASACALATAAAPPPLRGGGWRPLAPYVPKRGRLPVMRACWGLAPPCPPRFPKGESLPIMRASAWYRVRNGFCGNAFANLRGSSSREAARSSAVPSRELRPKAAPARPQGESQRGRSPLWPVFAYFLQEQKVGAPRGPSASKGESKNFKKRVGDQIK